MGNDGATYASTVPCLFAQLQLSSKKVILIYEMFLTIVVGETVAAKRFGGHM